MEDVGMVIRERKRVIHERKNRIQAQCRKQLGEAMISDFFFVMCASALLRCCLPRCA